MDSLADEVQEVEVNCIITMFPKVGNIYRNAAAVTRMPRTSERPTSVMFPCYCL